MKLPITYQPTTPEPTSKSQLKRFEYQKIQPTSREVLQTVIDFDIKALIGVMETPIDDGQCCTVEDKPVEKV